MEPLFKLLNEDQEKLKKNVKDDPENKQEDEVEKLKKQLEGLDYVDKA
jgi:hypothetical protein